MNTDVIQVLLAVLPKINEIVEDVQAVKEAQGLDKLDKIVELAIDGLETAELGLSKDILDNAEFEDFIRKSVAAVLAGKALFS